MLLTIGRFRIFVDFLTENCFKTLLKLSFFLYFSDDYFSSSQDDSEWEVKIPSEVTKDANIKYR